MAVPSASDINILEHGGRQDVPFYVFGTPRLIVASAQINTNVFEYPLVEIAVDNTSEDWLTEGLAGRQFCIGTAPGLSDVLWGVLRLDVDEDTIFIDPKQVGEYGYAADIQFELSEDYYVSILKNRPPWGHSSSIRKKVFYKFWNRAYDDEGRNPDPIVRMGPHQAIFVPDQLFVTGGASFDASESFVFPGRTIDSYAWGIDSGSTGDSLDGSSISITFPPGFYEVTCKVTDSKGKSRTGYRYVWVGTDHPDDEYGPLNLRYRLSDAECVQDPQGFIMTLTFQGDLGPEVAFPGQMIVLQENPTWAGGQSLETPGVVADQFVGYVSNISHRIARGVRETVVTVESPMKIAERITIENQYIQEVKNPNNWSEVTSILSNPLGVLYYLSAHHAPYLIDGHDLDFFAGIQNLRRKIHNPQGKTLGSQLRNLMQFFVGNIGSRADGTTRMVQNPLYFTTENRNALDTKWTWAARHIVGELNFERRIYPQVGKTFGFAFSYNGEKDSTPYASLAPGNVRSQAEAEESMTPFTVSAGAGQTAVNIVTGMHHARMNARTGVYTLKVFRNIDVAQPCDLDEFHALNLPAYYDPYGDGWVNMRVLPTRVTRRWSGPRNPRKEITVEFEPETFGYPGITVPVNPGGANNNSGGQGPWIPWWLGGDFDPYQPKVPDFSDFDFGFDITRIVAWNSLFVSGNTSTFASKKVQWEHLRNYVVDVAVDRHSDYFTVDTDQPLEMAFLVYNPTDEVLELYRLENLLADTKVFTLLKNWGNINADENDFIGHARVCIDPIIEGYWVVAWRNLNGITLDRSTDSGATWGGPLTIGSSMDEPDGLYFPVGMDVYSGHVAVAAKDGSTDLDGNFVYFVYKSTSTGGAFSKVNNPSGWSVQPGCIAITTGPTSTLVPLFSPDAPVPDDPLETVTFDVGGYPNYSVSGGPSSNGTGSFLGFGGQGDMAYASCVQGFGLQATVNVVVNLTAFYSIQQVSFFAHRSIGWTLLDQHGQYTVTALDADDNVVGTPYTEANEPGEGFYTGTFTVTGDQLGLQPDDQVYKIVISLSVEWEADGSGSGQTFALLDDIEIQATLLQYDRDQAIHSLSLSSNTYTRRHSNQKLPLEPYALAVNTTNGALGRSKVSAVVSDETGSNTELLASDDGGATWRKIRNTPGLTGLKRGEEAAVLFGHSLIGITIDVDETCTAYAQHGDWAEKVIALSKFLGVAGPIG